MQGFGEYIVYVDEAGDHGYLGHDAFALHEREIRKQQPPFEFLHDAVVRPRFLGDLSVLIATAPFELIGRHVIDPRQRNQAYEVLMTKFWGAPGHRGIGLHVLP